MSGTVERAVNYFFSTGPRALTGDAGSGVGPDGDRGADWGLPSTDSWGEAPHVTFPLARKKEAPAEPPFPGRFGR